MQETAPTQRFTLSLAGVLASCVVLGACEDAGSNPTGVIVSEETQGALLLVLERSGLPSLVAESGRADHLQEASEQWEASWDMTLAEARAARAEAYRLAAPALADGLGLDVITAATDEVGRALAIIEGLAPDDLAPSLEKRMKRAAAAHERGSLALEEASALVAVQSLLEASDALREVTPRRLATLLRATAEDALGRIVERDAYPEETLRRAERLVKGANSAIATAEYARAIRRAYYAVLLLGADLP